MFAYKSQIYGSQTKGAKKENNMVLYVWPIEDIENVDARRKEMDLPPIDIYLDLFRNQGDVNLR